MIISIESVEDISGLLRELDGQCYYVHYLPKPRDQMHSYRDVIDEIRHWCKPHPPGLNVICQSSQYVLRHVFLNTHRDIMTPHEYTTLIQHFNRAEIAMPDAFIYVCNRARETDSDDSTQMEYEWYLDMSNLQVPLYRIYIDKIDDLHSLLMSILRGVETIHDHDDHDQNDQQQ